MNFNERRLSTLLQTPAIPLTWDSILKECERIEKDHAHIRSEFQWALDYKRFQVEVARGNRSAGLIALRAAIGAAPENADILGDYKNYVAKPAIVENIVLIVTTKKNEEKAAKLAWQFDKGNIQYLIVSGSDTASIAHIRALQVDASDSYEGRPKKVAAALTWIYENVGSNVGVLKVDDEMTLQDAAKLQRSLTKMAAENGYAGMPVALSQFDRCSHWGKCDDPAMNRRVYGRPVLRAWADGKAYYLGPGAVEKIVFSLMRFPGSFEGEFYEEKLVGDVLLFEGVALTPMANYAEFGLGIASVSSASRSLSQSLSLSASPTLSPSPLGSGAASRLSKIL
ncbi:MAG: hypothetical protein JWQ10_1079 [Herbaspirillum sp.]|nr:hypothetical protein [Herbaspirillum sp.]